VSIFAVAAGRVFCGGTGCASAVDEKRISTNAARCIRQLPGIQWLWRLADLRARAMLALRSFADDFGHFVELYCVVSASSLFRVSGNSHDKKNDAARQRSPAFPSRKSRTCAASPGLNA